MVLDGLPNKAKLINRTHLTNVQPLANSGFYKMGGQDPAREPNGMHGAYEPI